MNMTGSFKTSTFRYANFSKHIYLKMYLPKKISPQFLISPSTESFL